jgi:hypothetical protein
MDAIGAAGALADKQVAINGQLLRQSGAPGASSGQHGMSAITFSIAAAGCKDTAALAPSGAAPTPRAIRTRSRCRSVTIVMGATMRFKLALEKSKEAERSQPTLLQRYDGEHGVDPPFSTTA